MITDLKPPTYPGRPRNGGPLDLALKAGQYHSANGDMGSKGWWERVTFQPKYNGWRAMVHAPTGRMWNRYNHEFTSMTTVKQHFTEALAQLKEAPFEWLDVEALERRHDLGVGSLIVLDWVTPNVSQQDRHTMLELYLPDAQVGSERKLKAGCYLVTEHASDIDETLKAKNEALDCVFYEGVVSKQIKSEYPMQLNGPEVTTPAWVKHRFTTL
jgi:hypothetical protein